MKTVVVALDLPATVGPTLETSIKLARALGARLVALHIVRLPVAAGGQISASSLRLDDNAAQSERAAAQLTRLQRRLQRRGVTIETRHVVGLPGPRIVEFASLLAATYVVIGAHDRGPFVSSFLGGTTTQVMREAPCPVVVAPPAARARSVSSRGFPG
jgi:nucleotide-binding universal stress UspA family protein